MKILPVFNLVLILQACFLPKLFWWQLPLGLMAFYIAVICLIFTKARIVNGLLCCLWLVVIFCPTAKILKINNQTVYIEIDQKDHNKIDLDLNAWQFRLNPDSGLEKLAEINDLQQKQGRLSLLELRDSQNQQITIAAIELDRLFSSAKWSSNKIFLRRLASILRQEQGQVIVYMRARGPFFMAVVRTFAFQARLNLIETENQILHLSGLGSDLILRRY